MKKAFISLFCTAVSYMAAFAGGPVVDTRPETLQTDSRDIVITYHADRGNGALKALPDSVELYAHTGVLTSGSTGVDDWRYASLWGDNSPKYRMTRVATDTYQLRIKDIDSFYGIADTETESPERLAFVFRDAAMERVGSADDGEMVVIDLLQPGLQIVMSADRAGRVEAGTTVNVTVSTTRPSRISVYMDGVGERPVAVSKAGAHTLEARCRIERTGDCDIIAIAEAGGQEVITSTKITATPRGADMMASNR